MSALNYSYIIEKYSESRESDTEPAIIDYILMDKAHSLIQSRLSVCSQNEHYISRFKEVRTNLLRVIALFLDNNPHGLIEQDLQKLRRYVQIISENEIEKEEIDEILKSLVDIFRKYNEE